MPPPAGPHAARPGDVAGVLRLLAYIVLAVTLMVLDHRGGWLAALRHQAEVAVQPLWWLASLPSRTGKALREDAVTRNQLAEDNKRLRSQMLVIGARNARLQAAAAENERLRGMLASAERNRLDVQLARILDVDMDPTRQRLVLDAGRNAGVRVGQPVIDAGGLMGQVIAVTPLTATVLLLTDPDHAVPVIVARTGVRLVVQGSGRSDVLQVGDIPLSADVRTGDQLLTSGLGGLFPAGFMVGTLGELKADDSRAFLEGPVVPAAQLDRGRDVLLLRGHAPVPPASTATTGTTGTTAAPATPSPASATVPVSSGVAPPSGQTPAAAPPGTEPTP